MALPPFQALVDAHLDDVTRLTAALAGREGGADAAQATWLAALRGYPALRHGRNLRGWLLTIAARCAMDWHRDVRRAPVPVAEPERPDEPVQQAVEPLDGDLWAAVRRLPERQRTAVALRYVLDLPHADVAAALGCTETTSRRLVSDALGTLRTEVDP